MPLDQESERVWQAIEGHGMPHNFKSDLMSEHQIRHQSAARAIEEYRRFIYLAVTSDGVQRVPCQAVEHVWHAHMMHSRDYWDVFCATIGRPIHHTPRGRGHQYALGYSETLVAYRETFGDPHLTGLWPRCHRINTLVLKRVGLGGVFLGMALGMNNSALWGLLAILGAIVFAVGALLKSEEGDSYINFDFGNPWAEVRKWNADTTGDGGGCGGD